MIAAALLLQLLAQSGSATSGTEQQNPAFPPVSATVEQRAAPAVVSPATRSWMPWQGHIAFQGMLMGPLKTLGVETYLGRTSGLATFGQSGHGGGWFFGYGLHGTFGTTQALDSCRKNDFCVGRWFLAPSARAGWAWGFLRENENVLVPDGYLYAEVAPFLGRTSIADAPLLPGTSYLEAGTRFVLGVNLVGWTRLATGGMGDALGGMHSGNELVVVLAWLALAITNHFELEVEVSRGIAGHQVRGGFTVGAGF